MALSLTRKDISGANQIKTFFNEVETLQVFVSTFSFIKVLCVVIGLGVLESGFSLKGTILSISSFNMAILIHVHYSMLSLFPTTGI